MRHRLGITHFLTARGDVLCGAPVKPHQPASHEWQQVDCASCQSILFQKPEWRIADHHPRRLTPGQQRIRDRMPPPKIAL